MDKNEVGLVYGKLDEAAAEVRPACKYVDPWDTEFLMTREQLADYARRVFKVAVQKAL